ncbi:thioredoxin reductase [Phytohabitans aurantiacus]|uniref:Thioredoxin reductase n=1 Tax=Phytohabitans aurantiacus TaxID=3016789 RepID=A0ABQ5R9V0_9ACTN|nr:thioredoxin reductase [Phytohabitans aurantiacus]
MVGGGAAGLSAALVLARARRRVVVVDAGAPRNAPAAHLHGFLSRDGMAPRDLLAAGRAEVTGYGGHLVDGTVDAIEPGFKVRLADGSSLAARHVLVTTGLRDELPGIPGVAERFGRDVLHCPYCHGYEVRDQPLGVVSSVHHALLVRQWSSDVLFFPHTATIAPDDRDRLGARGIRVVDGTVTRIVVEGDRLRGVELDGGTVVPRAAVFVGPRFVPNSGLLTGLRCAVDGDGWPAVDPAGRTSVAGVWAAGNAVDPRAQLITAAGAGSTAAIAINTELVEADIAASLAAFSATAERQVADAVLGASRHGM